MNTGERTLEMDPPVSDQTTDPLTQEKRLTADRSGFFSAFMDL